MKTNADVRRVSRRLAVGGAISASVASLGQGVLPAAAQAVNLADHPMAGMWLAFANPPLSEDPPVPDPAWLSADGIFYGSFPVTQRGPQGVIYNTPYFGVWGPDPANERRAHFTAVQVLSDAESHLTGTITVDGHPEASEDGQTFTDDGALVTVTIRDAAGVIIEQFPATGKPEGRPVTGVRMAVGKPGFPESSPAATPSTIST